MAIAGSKRPTGRAYSSAMSALLAEYRLGTLTETTRRSLLKIMEHRCAVEQWRARQKHPDGHNHPTYAWERFEKSADQQDRRDAERRPNTFNKLRIELEIARPRRSTG